VVLNLDRDVDWKMPPQQVLAGLTKEWRAATTECSGARIESAEDHSLSVTLPEPCGAQRISGKLDLWLVPHGGRSYATVHVDGKMGSFGVVARAFVDPSDQPKTACVTAELEAKTSGTAAHPAQPPPTTHGERMVTNMRLQRTLFGLFFPPLLLAPDPMH